MNFQETALNHVKTAGLLGDGFGSTPEMSRRNLIWVVTKMQVLVERYPSWLVACIQTDKVKIGNLSLTFLFLWSICA